MRNWLTCEHTEILVTETAHSTLQTSSVRLGTLVNNSECVIETSVHMIYRQKKDMIRGSRSHSLDLDSSTSPPIAAVLSIS